MTHLGDRVAPLIDGQLPVDVSGKAMTHLASCPACQEAADLERLTKQRLASLGAPQPGADLVRRLMALAGPDDSITSGPRPPQAGQLTGGSSYLRAGASYLPSSTGTSSPGQRSDQAPPMFRSDSSTRPAGRRFVPAQSRPPGTDPGSTRRLSRTTRSRLAFAAAGAACLVGVGVAGGVAATTSGTGGPEIVTPSANFVQRPVSEPNMPMSRQAALLTAATSKH